MGDLNVRKIRSDGCDEYHLLLVSYTILNEKTLSQTSSPFTSMTYCI